MGGKSRVSQATTSLQSTNNIVNDGDYAGVGGDVTHDESSFSFGFEDDSDHSVNTDIDNDIDNSVDIENDIDNSVENDIDNSVENDIDNSVENDIDNSVENDIDNSVENDGTFAGSSGNINVLDGGSIEKAFDFGKEALKQSTGIANNAVNSVSATARDVVGSLVDSQRDAFGSFEKISTNAFTSVNKATDKTLESLEKVSGEYATGLSDFSKSFVEEISGVQTSSSNDNKEQLKAIAELAKSTSLQGQDIVAENSTKMIMYVMGGIAVIALIGGGVALIKGRN